MLFKGGAALEGLAKVRSFAFDKTGTLTTGQAAVTQVRVLDGSEEAFLALAAGLEAHSEHPIAAAIRSEAEEREIVPVPVVEVRTHPSEGITGRDAEGTVWAGNVRMLAAMRASLPDSLGELTDGAETLVVVGRGAWVLGAVTVADEARETAAEALAALKAGAGPRS